jgi:hypothetical protein
MNVSSDAMTETPAQEPVSNTERILGSRRRWLIIIAVVAVGICACVGVGVLTLGRTFMGINQEQAAIAPVIDAFMQAIQARDTNRAYQLFSTRAQRQTAIVDLEALTTEPNYVLFDGYQSAIIDSTNLSTIANIDPNLPQGIVATVNGTITYAGGIEGTFRATLEKENNVWRLHAINITVPPSKTLP